MKLIGQNPLKTTHSLLEILRDKKQIIGERIVYMTHLEGSGAGMLMGMAMDLTGITNLVEIISLGKIYLIKFETI
jgi:hypothetical protein